MYIIAWAIINYKCNRDNDKVLWLFYEDLLTDLTSNIKAIAGICSTYVLLK